MKNTLLNEATIDKKFDTRVLEKNVERGKVSQEEADRFLKSLPDDADAAEFVSMDTLIAQDDKSGRAPAN